MQPVALSGTVVKDRGSCGNTPCDSHPHPLWTDAPLHNSLPFNRDLLRRPGSTVRAQVVRSGGVLWYACQVMDRNRDSSRRLRVK